MTRSRVARLGGALAISSLLAGSASAEPKINILHQWATGSDAAAIAKLGDMFTAAGGTWEQTSIAGHTANTLAKLRADVVAGNAPPAVQVKGPEIAEWNATGKMADMDAIAKAQGWDKLVAPELLPVMKPAGAWVAVPMNIHRINWLWGSGAAMRQAGVTDMPKTWADFNSDCEKVVKAGLICLAHFSEDWSDATTFEVVLYGQDIDLYRKALVEGDAGAMRGPGMVKAFQQLRLMVSKDMDRGIAGRDLDAANSMLGTGKAAFLIMGDWEIGMLSAAGFKVGTEIACTQAPTDWDKPGFILNSDSVGFFTQSDPDYQSGQTLLATLIMSPPFQTTFNQTKGSIPARLDIDLGQGFNPCQQKSQADLKASIADGTLVRSFAHNMTVPQKVRGAMMEVVTEFVNTDMSPEKAAANLADAAEAQE